MKQTAQEYTDELIEKLLLFQPLIPNYDRKSQSIQCALIDVSNTIDALEHIVGEDLRFKYYQDVKLILEKL